MSAEDAGAQPAAREVSSPGAQAALGHLRELLRRRRVNPELPAFRSGASYVDIDYREWVRRQLAESDIARQIAGGLDAFAEISDAPPGFLGELLKQRRPQTLKGMLEHLVRNLEWYLERQTRPRPPSTMAQLLAISGVAFLAVFGWLVWSLVNPGRNAIMPAFYMLLSGAALVRGMLLILSGNGLGGEDPNGPKYLVNCIELYHHLKQAYCDAPDGVDPAAVLPASELQASTLSTQSNSAEAITLTHRD